MRIGRRTLQLNALNGFEAVGRHLNMRRAAEELNVTQSAVSHQVRALERSLEVRLFDRRGRGLVLTTDGELLLQAVQSGFAGISAAAAQLGGATVAGTLRIAVPPSFGTQWLMPRLPSFLARHPALSVAVRALVPDARHVPGEVDVAVAFEAQRFPGWRVQSLVEIEMFPVCVPELAPEVQLGPGALRDATLIHEDDGTVWSRWFAATGTEQYRTQRSVYVASTHDAIELAARGAGFAINDAFMGASRLGSGVLVRPFQREAAILGRYSLLTVSGSDANPAARAFEEWLRGEVAETASTM